jgi:peptidoglycan/LPS O-acetylase OafA/YrhL
MPSSTLPLRNVAPEPLARQPAAQSTVRAGRMECMDFLRGIGALAVALQHCGEAIFPAFSRFSFAYFNIGQFGLIIFFLVSGFVIPLSLERGRSLQSFWIHRFFRLFPLYWFSLLAVVAIYLLGFTTIFEPSFRMHLWRNVLGNITMFQGVLGIPQAIGLYYTLTIELFFYIACAILLLVHQFRNSYRLTWLLLFTVSTLWIGGPLLLHRRTEMAGLFYGFTLFAGTSLYRYFKGTVSAKEIGLLLGAMFLSASWGVYLNDVVLKKPGAEFSYIGLYGSWIAGFVLFFGMYALRDRKFPAAGMWLGRISYSVYLIHPIASFLFRETRLPAAPMFILTIGATLVMATLTYYALERPMIELGHRLVKRETPQPRIAALHVVPRQSLR